MPASIRRKVAVASWRPSKDGRLYGRLVLDAGAALRYVAELRASSGVPVTLTPLVVRAVAQAQREVPEAAARIVLGRVVPYPSIDVTAAVDVDDGRDLGPTKVRAADTLTVLEIARLLAAGAARLRSGGDPEFERSSAWMRRVRWVPTPALRPGFAVVSLLAGGLGWPAFGQRGFPLGSALVSNVGTLGLDEGFLAPLPWARTPLHVLVGRVRDAPAVVAGAVVVRPQLVITATADHRLLDGAHAGRVARVLRRVLENPQTLPG